MRTLLPLAAVLVALAGARADEKIAAPVPKTPPVPSIEGKYALLATSSGLAAPAKGFGPGRATDTDPWGGPTRALRSEVVISKNEITIESRTVSANPVTMEYTLDPTKSPIAIDVEQVSVRGKKTKMQGIVEVSGNRVILALARDGGDRPKTTDDAEGVLVYYFQKAPPPPKVEFRIVAMTAGKEADAEKELNKLAQEGYELVSTTNPLAVNDRSSPTTIHFVLKRTAK
jgi:uncharacterized protein (TIGR03067 family)